MLLELLLIVCFDRIEFYLVKFDFSLDLDISVGRAGYPLISCEIRLINWDDGHYKNTDKPHPRGEILIGGKVVAHGYVPGVTNEDTNFREINGTRYFCTGDIGEIFPDGTLKIIGLLFF